MGESMSKLKAEVGVGLWLMQSSLDEVRDSPNCIDFRLSRSLFLAQNRLTAEDFVGGAEL